MIASPQQEETLEIGLGSGRSRQQQRSRQSSSVAVAATHCGEEAIAAHLSAAVGSSGGSSSLAASASTSAITAVISLLVSAVPNISPSVCSVSVLIGFSARLSRSFTQSSERIAGMLSALTPASRRVETSRCSRGLSPPAGSVQQGSFFRLLS